MDGETGRIKEEEQGRNGKNSDRGRLMNRLI